MVFLGVDVLEGSLVAAWHENVWPWGFIPTIVVPRVPRFLPLAKSVVRQLCRAEERVVLSERAPEGFVAPCVVTIMSAQRAVINRANGNERYEEGCSIGDLPVLVGEAGVSQR
ncbi:hypothetical protein BFS79_05555 [Cutibacterium avidum]|nr:hypothetical protein BFS79_05555 [Cutibacterium avidum]